MDPIPKPRELLALHDITAELFDTLKAWFEVPDQVTISLADIDSAIEELGDPVLIAAMAMRKLQALRLLAQPGVRTTTDVVVTIVQDLDRAMLQAPAMWLKRAAAATDWDAELAAMVEQQEPPNAASSGQVTPDDPDAGPQGTDEASGDPQVRRFRELHAGLHRALRSVVAVSDGEIRVLE
ncbi:MAG: hypothetical protein ACLFUG_02635 [Nitriliruptoraceae bacterium]